jgi:hypothetical protein
MPLTTVSQIMTRTGVTSQTANYTLTLSDANTIMQVTSSAAVTVTIPTDASVDFPVGTQILIAQMGAGVVTVAAAPGTTVNGKNGAKTSGQYAVISIVKVAANSWLVAGDSVSN